MNTEQLKKTLFDYECMRKTFIEITAINALPKELPSTYPQLYVVNTDPLPNPGKHWVCVIFSIVTKVYISTVWEDHLDFTGRVYRPS